MPEVTYGVGPAVAGKNVGPEHSTVSRLGPYGRVYNKDGELVFDPTVSLVEQIDPDDQEPAEPLEVSFIGFVSETGFQEDEGDPFTGLGGRVDITTEEAYAANADPLMELVQWAYDSLEPISEETYDDGEGNMLTDLSYKVAGTVVAVPGGDEFSTTDGYTTIYVGIGYPEFGGEGSLTGNATVYIPIEGTHDGAGDTFPFGQPPTAPWENDDPITFVSNDDPTLTINISYFFEA